MADTSFDRAAFLTGIKDAVALATPAVPFGLVLGLAIVESPVVDNFPGWSSSVLVFAGSAQLVAVNLLTDEATAAIVVVTILMINARHIMYSAAIAGRFVGAPTWFRVLGSYLLIDQAFAIAQLQSDDQPLRTRMWHHLGAGTTFFLAWVPSVALGLAIGDVVPDSWSLDFAVPLLFGSLMLLSIRDHPGVVAAVVGATTALVTRDFPPGTGLLLAIFLGVAAGGFADRRRGLSNGERVG